MPASYCDANSGPVNLCGAVDLGPGGHQKSIIEQDNRVREVNLRRPRCLDPNKRNVARVHLEALDRRRRRRIAKHLHLNSKPRRESAGVKHAELVSADNLDAAFELLRGGQADAIASIRDALLDYSDKLSGSRVLEGAYGVNRIAIPKGKAAWLTSINELVEEAKASGLIERTIDHAGLRGFRAAPRGNATGQ